MKLTDRKLKKLLRENPIQVNPAEKEEFLKQIQRETGGIIMKKRNLRPILAAVIALIGVTMLVSAGAIAYYYRTPGGNLVDESGNIAETITEADSMVNDRTISNGEVTIASVTWAQAENHTTLAVWLPADETELVNPAAIVNGKEYPLTKKTFNLTGGMIGYTAVDVPKPETLKIRCESPAFEETVNFQPDNIMSECTIGGITLDDRTKSVLVEGEEVSLTPTEYAILHLLMKNPGKVFSTKTLYESVWQEAALGSEGAVAVHIRHLREKIEINPSEPRYLKVVWGQGYKMEGGK